MASLMMGGDGSVESEVISEIEISAASEAMNQMIGSASTSLSTMFGKSINISPPTTNLLENPEETGFKISEEDETMVVVSFDMKIGDLVDTEIMQILSVETAKEAAALMWDSLTGAPVQEDESAAASEDTDEDSGDAWLSKDLWPGDDTGEQQDVEAEQQGSGKQAVGSPKSADSKTGSRKQFEQAPAGGFSLTSLTPEEKQKLELLLDVPLKVSVVLGRTKRPIKEVLNLTPGAIVEMNSLVDEPVEVLVNGTLVAKGEVVVVNENFGVRITYIMSPEERLKQLKE